MCGWPHGDGCYERDESPINVSQLCRCSPWKFEWWLIQRQAAGETEPTCFKDTSATVDLSAYVGAGPFPLYFRCHACYSHDETKKLFFNEGDGGERSILTCADDAGNPTIVCDLDKVVAAECEDL